MAVRVFADAEGSPWQVWDVHPTLPDRRSGRERRAQAATGAQYARRRGPDRRVRDVGRPAAIAGPLAEGWLCFETVAHNGESVRRRLTPIPPDWDRCDAAALRASLAQSIPGRRAIVPLSDATPPGADRR